MKSRSRRRSGRPGPIEALEGRALLSGGLGTLQNGFPPSGAVVSPISSVVFPLERIENQVRGPLALPQFNPALGQLVAVEIGANANLTGQVQVENIAPFAVNTIVSVIPGETGFDLGVAGLFNLAGGFSLESGNIPVSLPAFDGTIDFNGPSGTSFGQTPVGSWPGLTTDVSDSLVLMAGQADLSAFLGTGTVPVTFLSTGGIQASDPTGNFAYLTGLEAGGTATIRYAYVPFSMSGYVFCDTATDGLRVPGVDRPIPNVTITLTGTDDLGNTVNLTTQTNADGFYSFEGLAAGTYTVTQEQPAGFLDGLNSIGGQVIPGSEGVDTIVVTLGQQTPGLLDVNFAEIGPAPISGTVFLGFVVNGVEQPTNEPVAGALVRLTGTNYRGETAEPRFATTDASGNYVFDDVVPGTYTLTLFPPNTGEQFPAYASSATVDSCGPAVDRNLVLFEFTDVSPEELLGCIVVTPTVRGIHNQNTEIALTFSERLDPASATNPAFYQIVSPGRDMRFGTRDDQLIGIQSIRYDEASRTVFLVPSVRMAMNSVFMLTVIGPGGVITNTPDGQADGLLGLDGVCGNFTTIVQRGTHLHYTEADGDRVQMGVSRGGVLTLFRDRAGDARRLLVHNGSFQGPNLVPNRSFLQISVTRRGGDGLARIPQIQTAEPIDLRFRPRTNISIGEFVVNRNLPPAALPGGGLFNGRFR